jgi:hypothetical protein
LHSAEANMAKIMGFSVALFALCFFCYHLGQSAVEVKMSVFFFFSFHFPVLFSCLFHYFIEKKKEEVMKEDEEEKEEKNKGNKYLFFLTEKNINYFFFFLSRKEKRCVGLSFFL